MSIKPFEVVSSVPAKDLNDLLKKQMYESHIS
jgi:hypothetical protein